MSPSRDDDPEVDVAPLAQEADETGGDDDLSVDAAPLPPEGDEAGPDADSRATQRPRFPDVAELSYEQARDELAATVQRLESGQVDLETSVALWERGEALADHCERWLDGAQARLDRRDAPE